MQSFELTIICTEDNSKLLVETFILKLYLNSLKFLEKHTKS